MSPGRTRTAPMLAAGATVATGLDDIALRTLALARPELAWPVDRDIALAQNAHTTNTRAALSAALRGDYDWLEGDVSMQDGVAVMRHRNGDFVDLDLASWVQLVAASGRGLKVDVKDAAALPAVLALARASGMPPQRLIFNVTMLPPAALQSIRRAFPDAIINLSPVSDAHLSWADVAALQVSARLVGGRVMFPIRLDQASQRVVSSLRQFGRVAIWNQPLLRIPGADERDRLRAMGVDGMIDLRMPSGAKEWLGAALVGAAVGVLGRDPVHTALDALELF